MFTISECNPPPPGLHPGIVHRGRNVLGGWVDEERVLNSLEMLDLLWYLVRTWYTYTLHVACGAATVNSTR